MPRMRITPLLALACLAGLPSTMVLAADAAGTDTAPAAAVAIPAANKTMLEKCMELAGQVSGAAHKAESTAATAASLPFAGGMAKSALEAAKAKVADSDGLLGDLKGLLGGKPAASEGVLSQVAKGSFNIGERLKGLPGAELLQQALGAPGMADGLLKMLPVDKLPGYDTVQQLLAKIGK